LSKVSSSSCYDRRVVLLADNGVEVVYMDTDKLVSEGQEWEDRYERIIQEGQVISEEELDS
jgi:DNA polymerase elongation subunit (family B)